MVEDIRFSKNLPKVSRAKRVERTARQDEEKQKQSFQNYLNRNEKQLKDDKDGQDSERKTTTSNPTRANHENSAVQTTDKPDGSENDMQGKRIDVHA
jgi:hypothetical protein